jgi:hypothetical protein
VTNTCANAPTVGVNGAALGLFVARLVE